MRSNKNAFNEVRNILQKLDRSIDVARARRLGEDEPIEDAAVAPAEPIAPPSGGRYGRATPIRRDPNDA